VTGSQAVRVHAAALAGLPGMTPVRLAKITDGFTPVTAWRALVAGAHPGDPMRRFEAAARTTEVDAVARRYRTAGVTVLVPGERGYPSRLEGDPGAPAVLFALGDPGVLEGRPRVAIVGTRSATPYGRRVAMEIAADLAGHGVVVVSGLAAGIDAAAHVGALGRTEEGAGPPVGVVGTGLDQVYPASSRSLWEDVSSRGAVLAESPLGTVPRPGVFPARNRIIAALSDVVVVVESHHRGGSLYTAEAAARRGIPVCAVPGSVKSLSSSGTNALLVDGCIPVRDATDVLVAVSLAGAATPARTAAARPSDAPLAAARPSGGQPTATRPAITRPAITRPAITRPTAARPTVPGTDLTPLQRSVLEALDETPTPFETLLLRTDLSVAEAAQACEHLVERGMVETGAGWWSRRS